MKYDIEEANFNFTKIVNSIKPHTFKMKEEKEMGITKSHMFYSRGGRRTYTRKS